MIIAFLNAAILNDFVGITLRGALPLRYAAKLNAAGIKVIEYNENCGLWLKGEAAEAFGADLPCLLAAEDDLGNWTVITLDFRTMQLIGGKEVA